MNVNRRFLYWGVFLVARAPCCSSRRARPSTATSSPRPCGSGPSSSSRSASACSCAAPGSAWRAACSPPRCPGCCSAGSSWPRRGMTPECRGMPSRRASRHAAGLVRRRRVGRPPARCGELSVTTAPGSGWHARDRQRPGRGRRGRRLGRPALGGLVATERHRSASPRGGDALAAHRCRREARWTWPPRSTRGGVGSTSPAPGSGTSSWT